MKDTKQQFEHVIAICRDLFAKKLHDYGAAWRIMRPSSVTDQIFIKANRIRSIETKGVTMVDDCLLYTSPSPRDMRRSRMPSSA